MAFTPRATSTHYWGSAVKAIGLFSPEAAPSACDGLLVAGNIDSKPALSELSGTCELGRLPHSLAMRLRRYSNVLPLVRGGNSPQVTFV